MSATVHIPTVQTEKVQGRTGDNKSPANHSGVSTSPDKTEILFLSRLLKIKPEKVTKYLVKKMGDRVEAGEIIAVKKGLFSTDMVKSPVTGRLFQVDLKKGTISILVSGIENKSKISEAITRSEEGPAVSDAEGGIKGKIFSAVKGSGIDVSGKLVYFETERINFFEIGSQVEERIAACRFFPPDALIKLDALGAVGLIVTRVPHESLLPWVLVSEEIFAKLAHFSGKKVMLRPSDKKIIGEEI